MVSFVRRHIHTFLEMNTIHVDASDSDYGDQVLTETVKCHLLTEYHKINHWMSVDQLPPKRHEPAEPVSILTLLKTTARYYR